MPRGKKTPICSVESTSNKIDLSPEQCSRFGVTGVPLGEGSNATVYMSALDKKSVVKFTKDESDATAMRRLAGRGKTRPGLPVVYEVAKLRGAPGVYAIRMEYLETGLKRLPAFSHAADILLSALDQHGEAPMLKAARARRRLDRKFRSGLKQTFEEECDDQLPWDSDKAACKAFGKQLIGVVDDLAQEGIASFDLHKENFGFRRRRPVVIDMGVSWSDAQGPRIDLAGCPRLRDLGEPQGTTDRPCEGPPGPPPSLTRWRWRRSRR